MTRFSFLIPLYNGEQYIAQCLNSLLNQDIPHDEYEILCLDDCSPDNVADVVAEYSVNYPCIKLFRNETNCRVATSCNKLASLAQGKYFTTMGQDDYYEPNCLGRLWNKLETEQLDVLVFNYRYVSNTGELIKNSDDVHDTSKMKGTDWLHHEFDEKNYCQYLLGYDQRALYRTDFWREKGIRCVDGINYEDTVIMMKAIVHSNAVASISDTIYNYRQNQGSIMHTDNHIKKGLYIYEFAFPVGQEVEEFYYELSEIDDSLAGKLLVHLRQRYNSFWLDVIRTNRVNKRAFYDEVERHKEFIKSKKRWLDVKSKILLSPYFGFVLSRFFEFCYRIKKAI